MAWNPVTLLDHCLISVQDAYSGTAEQFRLLHARLEQSQKSQGHKTLCITSSVKGEGKTFTAVNLALTMARDFGRKALLMDVDCKKTVMLKMAGLQEQGHPGWVDVILKRHDLGEAIIPFTHERLFLLPVGTVDGPSSNLVTILGSSGLMQKLRGEFDYVVLDGPPVLPLADMKLLEDLVEGIILVVRTEKTTRDEVMKATSSLKREKIIGFILNDVKQTSKPQYDDIYSKHHNGNRRLLNTHRERS